MVGSRWTPEGVVSMCLTCCGARRMLGLESEKRRAFENFWDAVRKGGSGWWKKARFECEAAKMRQYHGRTSGYVFNRKEKLSWVTDGENGSAGATMIGIRSVYILHCAKGGTRITCRVNRCQTWERDSQTITTTCNHQQ
ncbi:hypothetical protein GOBAR_AA22522 [Gossypium barbadense]|uniref:Uncharacterized protein n=1 Tax=Gossypium barbadense TaxID=3634 RepID=A0A2P5X473_GOSBA|nr:hypothetical protein GOBAR_AA22522 [Gossypium barbadense]